MLKTRYQHIGKRQIAMVIFGRVCVVIIAVSFMLSGCRDESRNGYFELTGRVFVFNPRMGQATYVVSLGILKDVPNGARIQAVFENPAGGEKIMINEIARVLVSKIAVESPPVLCIKKDRRYAFDVTLTNAEGVVLQTLSSSIKSSLDQSIMPDVPLVVGNAYEPNPELQGNASGKLPTGPKHKCPS
jgi:hypothetical protein